MSTLEDVLADTRGIPDRVAEHDVSLIVGTALAIYAGYILLGVIMGFGLNGLMNSLVRLTFLMAVYALGALALNLHWGYTGLFNVGVVGFMAVGIYTMGIATAPTNPATSTVTPGLGLPAVVGILLGMVAAGVAGFLAALPALRLRSDYFAIITLGMAETIRLTLTSNTFRKVSVLGVETGTGGNGGLSLAGDPSKLVRKLYETGYGIGALDALTDAVTTVFEAVGIEGVVVVELTYVLILIGIVWAVYWMISNIGRSPFGRVLKSIREDEDVASSLGKNVPLVKIKSFVIGSALLGLVGILWMGSRGIATPSMFKTIVTVFVWVVVIIGGTGSNTGSVLGAVIFAGVIWQGPRFLRTAISATTDLPDAPPTVYQAGQAMLAGEPTALLAFVLAELNYLQFVFLGVILIYLIQKRPEGLLGHRKEPSATIDLMAENPNRGERSDGGTVNRGGEGG